MRLNRRYDEIEKLAIKLFNAGEAEKRRQPEHIWKGQTRNWANLPSESRDVWHAIAECALNDAGGGK